MEELITVIINVYNRENCIQKCLNSVVNQTYKNLEVLIINDGSTDNTLKICESYKDKRIRIITTENLGLSISRNIGIDNAKGEYIYFIDSDDYIEYDTIEYLYSLCKKYNVLLSSCKPMTVYNYDAKAKNNKKEKVEIIDSYNMLKRVLLVEESAGTTWNKLYKKELFYKIRFENRIINDIVVTYKIIIAADKIAYSNQKKYYYLKHSNAITVLQRNQLDRAKDLFEASFERYQNIKSIYPNFIENDVGMLRNIIKVYLVEDKYIEEFLVEKSSKDLFKDLFSFKIFVSKINIKLKLAIVLFAINPKLFKKIVNKFSKKKYEI